MESDAVWPPPDWQNKNLLGRFERTFPSELCVSPGRLNFVQIFFLLSSFSAHPRFCWLGGGVEEIIKNWVTWEKYGSVLGWLEMWTPGNKLDFVWLNNCIHYFPSAFKTRILSYFDFSFRRTFYPEYTLRPCAVLCQKGHTVWNSGSTFHQFWVGKKQKEKSSESSSHSLLAESRRTSSSVLSIFPPCCSNFPKVFATTVSGLFLLDSY